MIRFDDTVIPFSPKALNISLPSDFSASILKDFLWFSDSD
jgi:hypothetical protein